MTLKMMTGQRFKLLKTEPVRLDLEPSGNNERLLRSALFCFPEGKLGTRPPLGVVHTANLSLFDDAVKMDPGRTTLFRVDLARLASPAGQLVLTIWVDEDARCRKAANLNQTAPITVTLRGNDGLILATYSIEPGQLGRESAILHSVLYFKDGWRYKADGTGFLGGLPAMVSRLGMSPELVKQLAVAPPPIRSGGPGTSMLPGGGGASDVPAALVSTEGFQLPSGWAGGVAPKIPSGMLGAVARVITETESGDTATGTAFAITPGGVMVTCHHVISDSVRVYVLFNGQTELRPAVTMVSEPWRDLALLRMLDPWGSENWLLIDPPAAEFELGEEVGILGYPLGHLGNEINYSQGIINSVRMPDAWRVVQIDAGAAPGSSGGPLFRRADGRVMGVLSSGLHAEGIGMHANFAMDIGEVYKLGWIKRGE
jgi:hypothetical protein